MRKSADESSRLEAETDWALALWCALFGLIGLLAEIYK
jgi:hypothetical protein